MSLALLSMGSGFFAAAVVVALLGFRLVRKELSLRPAAPTLILGIGLIVLSWFTRVTVAQHEPLKAHTLNDFVLTALYALQWPTTGVPWTWLALILWLPWCWLVGSILRSGPRSPAGGRGLVLAGLGAWVILQILATGYARGAGAPNPASRYIDTLVFGAMVNALCWGWLWRSGAGRLPVAVLGVAWVSLFATGAYLQLHEILTVELPPEVRENFYEQQNMRNYLATGDEAYLHHSEIPYPDPISLLVRLSYPGLRDALPASVRAPLPLKSAGGPGAFVSFDSRVPERRGGELPNGRATGCSPATPLLSNRVTWGSFGAAGPGQWSSEPLHPPKGRWLRFEVAGQSGGPGAELELRDAATQRPLAEIQPDRVPGESWRSAYVRTPTRDFIVVAREENPPELARLQRTGGNGKPFLLGLAPDEERPPAGRNRGGRGAPARGGGRLDGAPRPDSRLTSMKFFTLPALLAAALFSAVVVVPFLPEAHDHANPFALEVRLAASAAGNVQVYYDTGQGIREIDSTKAPVPAGGDPRLYHLSLPSGTYPRLRLDPIDNDSTVVIDSARLVGRDGRIVREIGLDEFQPLNEIRSLTEKSGRLEVAVLPGKSDPQLQLDFAPPVDLSATWSQIAQAWLADWLAAAGGVWIALAAVLFGFDRAAQVRRRLVGGFRWIAERPFRAVLLVAAAAVLASSYPVAFLGKSFVSPNFGTVLLYDAMPTLPGYSDARTVDVKGSDIGAIMWQFVPFSMEQHQALFRDREWPVWNRDNSTGTPLLGQGYSMFGDPLHFLPVIANGAAWAWDLKFLAAKWLFAAGLGLIVLAMTRHLPAALLVSLGAPFVGFFLYRLNHPAIFSFCYAPWPLYCWLRAAQAKTLRQVAAWAGGLILANFALINTGTAKEAYMILLCLNFSGVCLVLSSSLPWRARFGRLALFAWAGLLFILFSSPVWFTFVQTLAHAYTAYNNPSAFQIRPGIMLGAFDEAFYRPLSRAQNVFNPSANFLILAGLLYFLATLRQHFTQRAIMALAASSLLPLSFAFGLMPAAWIVKMPFVANVAHIDNSFSCPLIVLWAVLAGVGFATAARRLGTPDGRNDLVVAGLLLFALVFNYVAFGQVVHRDVFGTDSAFAPLHPGETIPVHPFVWGYLVTLLVAVVAFGLLARRALLRRRITPPLALGFALCGLILLWRQGQQVAAVGFEDYVARPTLRTDFHAPSPAVSLVQAAQRSEPSRSVGLQNNFFPGWNDVYGLEGINGPDALVNPRYRELTAAAPLEKVWDWRLYLARDDVAAAQPFLDFLNVRFYFDLPSGQRASGNLLKLEPADDLDVYESPTAWPRAFFTDRISVYRTPAELIEQIKAGDRRPFAAIRAADLVVTPELNRFSQNLGGRQVVPATGYHLTANSTSFEIQAPAPGLVVLSEAWWPGYPHAEIDGHKTNLVRVNHAFEGVMIESPGLHRVTVRYRPPYFSVLLGLSAASLVLMAATYAGLLHFSRHGDHLPAKG